MGAKDKVDQQLSTKVLEKYLYQLALTMEKIHRVVVGVGTLSLRTALLGVGIRVGLGVLTACSLLPGLTGQGLFGPLQVLSCLGPGMGLH